jgi:hypothetical protein
MVNHNKKYYYIMTGISLYLLNNAKNVKNCSSNNVENCSSNNVENCSSNNVENCSSNNVENCSSNNVNLLHNENNYKGYYLEDYDYYDFNFDFKKIKNNTFILNLNNNFPIKLSLLNKKQIQIEVQIKFFKKKLILSLEEISENKYKCIYNFKPTLVEKLIFNYPFVLSFYIIINDDIIEWQLIDELDINLKYVLEKNNKDLFDYIKLKRYNLHFNKNKF